MRCQSTFRVISEAVPVLPAPGGGTEGQGQWSAQQNPREACSFACGHLPAAISTAFRFRLRLRLRLLLPSLIARVFRGVFRNRHFGGAGLACDRMKLLLERKRREADDDERARREILGDRGGN